MFYENDLFQGDKLLQKYQSIIYTFKTDSLTSGFCAN
jgi:hypothetical protein